MHRQYWRNARPLLRMRRSHQRSGSLRRPSFTVQTLQLCTRETRASNYPPLAPACQWEWLARFTRTSSQRAATRGTLPSHVPCTPRCPFYHESSAQCTISHCHVHCVAPHFPLPCARHRHRPAQLSTADRCSRQSLRCNDRRSTTVRPIQASACTLEHGGQLSMTLPALQRHAQHHSAHGLRPPTIVGSDL